MAEIKFYDLDDIKKERKKEKIGEEKIALEGIDFKKLQFTSKETNTLGRLSEETRDEVLMKILEHKKPCFITVDGALIEDGFGLDKGTNGKAVHLFNVEGRKRELGEEPKKGETWVFTQNKDRNAPTKYSTDKLIHHENGSTFSGPSFLHWMSPKAQIEAINSNLVSDSIIVRNFQDMPDELKLGCMDKINQLIAKDEIHLNQYNWWLPEGWKLSEDAVCCIANNVLSYKFYPLDFEKLINKLSKEELSYPKFFNQIKSDYDKFFSPEKDSNRSFFGNFENEFSVIKNVIGLRDRIEEVMTPEEKQKIGSDKILHDVTRNFLDALNRCSEQYGGDYDAYVNCWINKKFLEKSLLPENMYSSDDFRKDIQDQKHMVPWSFKHLSENKDLLPKILESPHYRPQIFKIATIPFNSKEMDDVKQAVEEYTKKTLDEFKKGTLQISLARAIPSSYAKQDLNGTIAQFFDKNPELLTSPKVYEYNWMPEEIFKTEFCKAARSQDVNFTRTAEECGELKEVNCTLIESIASAAYGENYRCFDTAFYYFLGDLENDCEKLNKEFGIDINQALNRDFFNELKQEEEWYEEMYEAMDEEDFLRVTGTI